MPHYRINDNYLHLGPEHCQLLSSQTETHRQKAVKMDMQKIILMGRKYPCEECDNKFTEKGSLNKHQKSVHMGKKYPCGECGRQFKKKISLNEHQKSVHRVMIYSCNL